MKIKEVLCKRWFINRRYAAITLYPFIFFNVYHRAYKENLEQLRRHEYVHVKQIKQFGVLQFYLSYLWESWKHGYMGNKYEKEAYELEKIINPNIPKDHKHD